jgi:hypothetical protein
MAAITIQKPGIYVWFLNGPLALTISLIKRVIKTFLFCIKWSGLVDHLKTRLERGW